jgi:hypothetical protein
MVQNKKKLKYTLLTDQFHNKINHIIIVPIEAVINSNKSQLMKKK